MPSEPDFKLPQSPHLGFIGLGAMGGGMAANLLAAGYRLSIFDLDPKRMAPLTGTGATPADDVATLTDAADVILTSLPSSKTAVEVIETQLLPAARRGQVIIDTGTTEGPHIRRLAAAMAEKGAHLLDAPVSGGSAGANPGRLYIFIGGDRAVYEVCRPILHTIGDPEHVTWCGPSGCGQAVKGVNQLGMGLVDAAFLEAVAYGVRGGVEAQAIARAVDGPEPWRRRLAHIARLAAEGRAEEVYIKFPELPWFLAEARDRRFRIPMTEALYTFCQPGPRNWVDNMGRPRVAYWYMLMQAAVDDSDATNDG